MFEEYRYYTFGDLLRSYRKRHGASLIELEESLGRHRNTIGAWERSEFLPKLRDDVLRLEQELHLSHDETDLLLYKAEFPLEYHQGPITRGLQTSQTKPYGYLRVCNPTGQQKSFVLAQPEHLLGRHPEKCDLVIPAEYELTGRVHAAIRFAQDQVFVEDLQSRNGTFVDGVKLRQPVRLQSGQHILLGGQMANALVCVLEFTQEPFETRDAKDSHELTLPEE